MQVVNVLELKWNSSLALLPILPNPCKKDVCTYLFKFTPVQSYDPAAPSSLCKARFTLERAVRSGCRRGNRIYSCTCNHPQRNRTAFAIRAGLPLILNGNHMHISP